MKTAFILGAGQIGSAVAERLADSGWAVTVASRGQTVRPPGLADRDIAAVTLDRTGPGAFGKVLADGADLVVDTIAYDVTHADQLIDVESSVGAFAVISSASVYADDDGMTLDEARSARFPSLPVPIREDQRTTEPGPATYSTRKVALERRLLDRATRPVAILRPCAIHGIGSPHPREWWFVKRLLDGRTHIPLAYEGESHFQTTATVNIAALVETIAGKSFTGLLNIPDPDAPSVREIGETLMRVVGRPAEFIPVPVLDDAYPPKMGATPWSIPKPFILDDTVARALSYCPVANYATAVAPMCDWMIETTETRDWREAFPVLATYPYDPFDYAAEDRWLAEKEYPMIDHITFGVSDFARSTAFYDRAFAPLGVTRLSTVPPEHTGGAKVTGYGDVRPWFWIAEQDATRGKLHIALAANCREAVDAFHREALAAGGSDNGAPGPRPEYHAAYYGAFVLDPDGHNIEAVFGNAAA